MIHRSRVRSFVLFAVLASVAAAFPVAAAGAAARVDLSASSVVAGAGSVVAGATLPVSVTVRDRGVAAKATTTAFFLSRDAKYDRADAKLGMAATAKVRKDGKVTVKATLTIPAATSAGVFHILACADGGAKLKERSERNNCAATPKTITVIASRGGVPTVPGVNLPSTAAPAPGAAAPVIPDATPAPQSTPGPTSATPTPVVSPAPTPTPTGAAFDPTAPGDGVAGRELTPTPLDPGGAESMRESTAFLYSGANAPQQGVAAGTIVERRASVVRGTVVDHAGAALAGVNVSVLDHPELGRTTTRVDGGYDLVVNGGGPLTLVFNRIGFIVAQRQVATTWQQYVVVDPVMLLALDAKVTTIDTSGPQPFSVAQGSTTADGDGDRQATLLFAKGTSASETLPDGSTKPLTGPLHVRATEFTQGASGIEAMPGSLPSSSGYTYAAEFSVDEAAGATSVHFDKPVVDYTQNFIHAPVGSNVPTAWYDRTTGRWVPSKNGRVIKVLSSAGGVASLSVTTADNGGAASQAELDALGITTDELRQIAALYGAGQELWRVSMDHFTPWDHNWPYGPDPDATSPDVDDNPPAEKTKDTCEQGGSIIGCESQTLGERIPIVGTPYTLNYRSDHQVGDTASTSITVPLAGTTVSNKLQGVRLTIDVAGRQYEKDFASVAPGQSYIFSGWDGLDAYGRKVNGAVPVSIELSYFYHYVYYASEDAFNASFAGYGDPGTDFSGRASCDGLAGGAKCGYTLSQQLVRTAQLQSPWDAKAVDGLGGWTIDAHAGYDANAHVLHLGDGTDRDGVQELGAIAGTSSLVAGDLGGPQGIAGDGMDARDVNLDAIDAMAVGADGSVYLHTGLNHNLIRRVRPDGTIVTIGGVERTEDADGNVIQDDQGDPTGDGQAAVGHVLGTGVSGLAVDASGDVYFGTEDAAGDGFIRRIGADGKLSTIAGIADHSSGSDIGDGGPATHAKLTRLRQLAIAPDGSLWFAENNGPGNGDAARIRRIDLATGTITTRAGGGSTDVTTADDGRTLGTKLSLTTPRGLSFGTDGSLLFALPNSHVVERLTGAGTIQRVAGNGASSTFDGVSYGHPALATQIANPVAVAQAPNGTIYVRTNDAGDGDLIFAVDGDGVARAVAGAVTCADPYGSTPAPLAPSDECIGGNSSGLAVTGDGQPIFSDGRNQIRRLHLPMPGFGEGDLAIPNPDGTQLLDFDAHGREQRAISSTSGHVVNTFGYDAQNRLTSITDAVGRTTTIERSASGAPTAIVAPGGQRTALSLDGNGMLHTVSDPAGDTTTAQYSAGGLLTSMTDPGGGVHTMSYDDQGLLTKDVGSDGSNKTLARTADSNGTHVTLTTKEGRVDTYTSQVLGDGTIVRQQTEAGVGTSVARQHPDGTTDVAMPSGEHVVMTYSADPRFGMQVPYPSSMKITSPAGRTETITEDRIADLDDPAVPTTLTAITDRHTRHWTNADGDEETSSTTSHYDRATNTTTVESPEGRQLTQVFDGHDRLVEQRAADVTDTQLSYGVNGLLSKVTQGAQSETYGYDAAQRVISETDALGHATQFGYDAADRTTSVTSPSGRTVRYGYDADGNRTSTTTPNGHVRHDTYTPEGSISGETTPLGATQSIAFDGDGQATTLTRPSGATVTNGRDSAGRVTSSSTSVGADPSLVTTFLDAGDRYDTRKTMSGSTLLEQLATTYDGDQRSTLAYSGKAAGTFTYDYDDAFRVDDIKLTSGADTVDTPIVRDKDGRITKLAGFTIDTSGPSGAATSIDDGTGTSTRSFGTDGQLREDAVKVAGHAVYDVSITRDAANRVTSRVETTPAGTVTWAYTYDADGQLTGTTRNGSPAGTDTYDADGNRTSGAATFDADDQPTGTGTSVDANGDVTGSAGWSYAYSASGLLLRATDGTATITYTYDATGRLVARDDGSHQTSYLYGDPTQPDAVTASRGADGVLTTYLYGQDGRLFALRRGTTQYYVGTDQVGSIRVVADATGSPVRTVEYDPWGVHLASSGTFDVPLGFAGGIEDPATGLVRFGQRWYDPHTGRFTSPDPSLLAGGTPDYYAYVANNPVGQSDPSGLFGEALISWVGAKVSAAATYIHDHVTPHDVVQAAEQVSGDSVIATTIREGDSALTTASEVGDKALELQDAVNDPRPGRSALGILACLSSLLSKAQPIEVTPVAVAVQAGQQGATAIESSSGLTGGAVNGTDGGPHTLSSMMNDDGSH